MLEVQELCFSFGSHRVVDGVNLSVKPGTIHGLIGPNGAGKTTCIDLISGKRKPASGKVIYRGDDITQLSIKQRRRAGLSRSFQRISVFDSMTVGDQIDLAARAVKDSDVGRMIDALDLESALNQPCNSISYGEQRRVDIALALVGHPSLVLLDEPAAGLSRDESLQLADHLAQLAADTGATVLIVEHHLEVIFRICDELTVLEQGQVIAGGDPGRVRHEPRVAEAYLGRTAT